MTPLLLALLLLSVAGQDGDLPTVVDEDNGNGNGNGNGTKTGTLGKVARTMALGTLSNTAKRELGSQACAMLSTGQSMTSAQLAKRLAEAAFPQVDWPPPVGAVATHAARWTEIQTWVSQIALQAASAGQTVCDFLASGGIQTGTLDPGAMPTPQPTPGRLYTIGTAGGPTNLLATSGRAYSAASGTSRRLAGAKAINAHPSNAGLRRRKSNPGFESSQFPAGIISYGVPFQTIFIPVL